MKLRKYMGPTGRVYTVEDIPTGVRVTGPGMEPIEAKTYVEAMRQLTEQWGTMTPWNPGKME